MAEMLTLISDRCDIERAYGIIAAELYVTGYPELPKFDKYKGSESVLIQLLNIVWTLVKHRKKYINNKLENEQCKATLEQNITILQKKLSDLECNYKIIKSETNKKIHELETMKRLQNDTQKELNNSKCAFQKTQKLLQSRNEEYCNKIRQKEYEIIELQKTLAQKVDLKRSSRNQSGCAAVISVDGVQTDESKEKCLKQIDSLYKTSICRLENAVTTLVQENINLRNSIQFLTKRMEKLHNLIEVKDVLAPKAIAQEPEIDGIQSQNDHDNSISDHLFNVPGDDVVTLIEKYVCDVTDKIADCLSSRI